MFYLHKLLPLIVSPLGLLLLLMLLSVFLRRIWPTYLALALMLAFSFPITSHLIWSSLESEYPYKPIEQVGQHDIVSPIRLSLENMAIILIGLTLFPVRKHLKRLRMGSGNTLDESITDCDLTNNYSR